jgi:hypothetical protein
MEEPEPFKPNLRRMLALGTVGASHGVPALQQTAISPMLIPKTVEQM